MTCIGFPMARIFPPPMAIAASRRRGPDMGAIRCRANDAGKIGGGGHVPHHTAASKLRGMKICLNRATAGGALPLDQFVALSAKAGFPGADVDLNYGVERRRSGSSRSLLFPSPILWRVGAAGLAAAKSRNSPMGWRISERRRKSRRSWGLIRVRRGSCRLPIGRSSRISSSTPHV